MKSLKAIQILAKIGYILSKIVFICSLIGAVLCAACLIALPFCGEAILRISSGTLFTWLEISVSEGLATVVSATCTGLIVYTGEAITAKFAEAYFRNERLAGTPFTESGAKEMSRLGIIAIAVPLGCRILADIVRQIVESLLHVKLDLTEMGNGGTITVGIVFVVVAVLCRYGAELASLAHHSNDQPTS